VEVIKGAIKEGAVAEADKVKNLKKIERRC
jgi:hypothetical protein